MQIYDYTLRIHDIIIIPRQVHKEDPDEENASAVFFYPVLIAGELSGWVQPPERDLPRGAEDPERRMDPIRNTDRVHVH